jgi:uncharacterized integral membrane protein
MSYRFEGGDPTGIGKGPGSPAPGTGRSRTPLLVAWGILALAALAFVFQNTERISFQFLFFDFRWPLWIFLLVFFLLGVLTGLLVAWRRAKA